MSEPLREQMLVGDTWLDAASGDVIGVEDPASRGRIFGTVPRGSEADVERAVEAAQAAFPAWRDAPWQDRARALLGIASAIEAGSEAIATTLTRETGSAIRSQARPEVRGAADIFRYFGGLASQVRGEQVPLGDGMLSYTRREPWGPVAAIVPWNAPVSLAALKVAPALAAGNTVVVKPSSQAPLAVVAMVRVAAKHLPAGVLNAVTGSGEEVGLPLTRHPLIRKISFTGDTATGTSLLHVAADRILPVTLELGGKSPIVVFPDADDETTAAGVVAAMRFTRQGQSCAAGSRLLVHESIFDSFLSRLAEQLQRLRVGDPLDEATDVGPMSGASQVSRVRRYIEDALALGGRLAAGGLPPDDGPLAAGYFALPTVLVNVEPGSPAARDEIFGPVLVAIPWVDEDQAVSLANDTDYGLAAYVWSRDVPAALRLAHRIEAGWVQINQGGGGFPGQSFGGWKRSGLGREYSLEGMLEAYTQRKNVTLSLADRAPTPTLTPSRSE